jgi:hypothetical protein
MYILHELKFDADNIVTAVVFTKALSEDVSCKVMLELLPPESEVIPYSDLTEETVSGWLDSHPEMGNVDRVLEKTQQQNAWVSTASFPWS